MWSCEVHRLRIRPHNIFQRYAPEEQKWYDAIYASTALHFCLMHLNCLFKHFMRSKKAYSMSQGSEIFSGRQKNYKRQKQDNVLEKRNKKILKSKKSKKAAKQENWKRHPNTPSSTLHNFFSVTGPTVSARPSAVPKM